MGGDAAANFAISPPSITTFNSSFANTTPITLSNEPWHTGNILCGASSNWAVISSRLSVASTHETSLRGVIIVRIERSANDNTPVTIKRSQHQNHLLSFAWL